MRSHMRSRSASDGRTQHPAASTASVPSPSTIVCTAPSAESQSSHRPSEDVYHLPQPECRGCNSATEPRTAASLQEEVGGDLWRPAFGRRQATHARLYTNKVVGQLVHDILDSSPKATFHHQLCISAHRLSANVSLDGLPNNTLIAATSPLASLPPSNIALLRHSPRAVCRYDQGELKQLELPRYPCSFIPSHASPSRADEAPCMVMKWTGWVVNGRAVWKTAWRAFWVWVGGGDGLQKVGGRQWERVGGVGGGMGQ